jgi:hypothetical protein
MRAWITKHLGAVAIESRIRGDRRAAIAAADGIAKAHGLQTTKVDVTHRSALDDLSTTQMLRLQKQMQQLVELMPLIRSGEIELVTPTVEGEAIEIFSVEDAMGVAAALDQGNTTCTEIDPLG